MHPEMGTDARIATSGFFANSIAKHLLGEPYRVAKQL
jgi:hypothetical protein